MVKTVLKNTGLETALVAVGWLAFVCSFLTSEPVSIFALHAIARVLP